MNHENETAYDENYTVEYYTVADFIAEYPELVDSFLSLAETVTLEDEAS